MPTHWTYSDFDRDHDLYQGDILDRTSALEELLSEVHAYFLDPKFIRFVVTTQTCDLVRRNQPCKAEHINLAVVRELEPMLPELIGKLAGCELSGIYLRSARTFALDLLKKIINQNELSRGMFYLHPDGDVGIATPSVAMLRITIAVRRDHYEILRDARRGRLDAEFRNKLGWLCGNLYSRIATPDWNEIRNNSDAASEQAESLLQSIDGPDEKYWVPDSWVDAAKEAGADFQDKPRDESIALLSEHAPPEPIESAIGRVREVALGLLAVEQATRLRNILSTDEDFLVAVATRFATQINAVIGSGDISVIAVRLKAEKKFTDAVLTTLFLNVKSLLETQRETAPQQGCGVLTAISLSTQCVRAMIGICKTIFREDWHSVEGKLQALHGEKLLDESLASHIVARLGQLLSSSVPQAIDKLASRLRNDSQFTKLFKRVPECRTIDLD